MMQYIQLSDCLLQPTNKMCPVCNHLFQLIIPKSNQHDFKHLYICSTCNFIGTDDVDQVPTTYAMIKEGELTFPDFTVDTIRGYAPLIVHFNENCFGFRPTEWLWNFGDSITYQGSDPTASHTYTSSGQYSVSLQVFDPSIGNKTITKDLLITVLDFIPPTADFIADVVTGYTPLTVHFLDQSAGSEVSSWEWTFGDTTTLSHLKNPFHMFKDPGIYDVNLKVFDLRSNTSTITKNGLIEVKVTLPVAQFTVDKTSGFTALDVQFTYTGDSFVTIYEWNFGDGKTSSDQNPMHTYNDPGTYTVTLNVINSSGMNSIVKTDLITVELYGGPPTAEFEVPSFDLESLPISVDFIDRSTGYGLNYWYWDFGDGNTSIERNPTHSYADYGSYYVKLIVYDAYDTTSLISKLLTLDIGIPIVKCDTTSYPDRYVQFNSYGTFEYPTYYWKFNDGTESTEQNPYHQFPDTNPYLVQFTISNPRGSDTTSFVVIPIE